MFSLSDGRLIRINKDGTNGEIIHSKKSTIVFGTSPLDDHHIKDVDPTNEVKCVISTDDFGRVCTNITAYLLNKVPCILSMKINKYQYVKWPKEILCITICIVHLALKHVRACLSVRYRLSINRRTKFF